MELGAARPANRGGRLAAGGDPQTTAHLSAPMKEIESAIASQGACTMTAIRCSTG